MKKNTKNQVQALQPPLNGSKCDACEKHRTLACKGMCVDEEFEALFNEDGIAICGQHSLFYCLSVCPNLDYSDMPNLWCNVVESMIN